MDATNSTLFSAPPEFEADECAAVVIHHSQMLGLRLGALFGILAAGAAGIVLPYLTNLAKLEKLIFLLRAFAGGVVLATGYIHILGDAAEGLSSPCLHWPDFPWAYTVATFASLVMFTFEWHLHRHVRCKAEARSREPPITNHEECTEAACAAHSLVTIGVENPLRQCTTPERKEGADHNPLGLDDVEAAARMERLTASVQSCTVEAGIVFHSIFIGIALGLNTDRSAVRSLMVALMFHQLNEGLAIGLMFLRAQYSALRYAVLGSVFMLTTPVGVAIGIAVGSSSYSPSTLTAVEGIFNSISAGMLLYNAVVDLILPTFSVGIEALPYAVQLLGFVALFLGAGIMALIALWA